MSELRHIDGSSPVVDRPHINIKFQHGNPDEVGINGCTVEDVIDTMIEKLDEFQRRGLACKENSVALWHLKSARDVMRLRAETRSEQGVRGSLIPHQSPFLTAELPPKFEEEDTVISR